MMNQKLESILKKGRPQPNGCLLYGNPNGKNPYGSFILNGKAVNAHRGVWLLANGEIPDGLQVLHKCDNPSCIRLDHLELGTQSKNIRDCVDRGRKNFVFGTRSHLAKLQEWQVVEALTLYHRAHRSPKALAERFGISERGMVGICRGNRWRHIDRSQFTVFGSKT